MSAKLHQTEMRLTVAGVTATVTLDVNYQWVPKDDGVGWQVEILSPYAPEIVRPNFFMDIQPILPLALSYAIVSEIEQLGERLDA